MISTRGRVSNLVVAALLLITTYFTLTNPQVQAVYARQGMGGGALYVAAGLRIAMAAALIFARGRALLLALRLGVLSLVISAALLPAGWKILAYPLSALTFTGVFLLARARMGAAAGTPAMPSVAGLARAACLLLAALAAITGAAYAGVWMAKANLLPPGPATARLLLILPDASQPAMATTAAFEFLVMAALFVPTARRATLGVLAGGTLLLTALHARDVSAATTAGGLISAAICLLVLRALPPRADSTHWQQRAVPVGCTLLAALLTLAAVWHCTDPYEPSHWFGAGFPAYFGFVLAGLQIIAAALLCAPPARRLGLGFYAAVSLAMIILNTLHGGLLMTLEPLFECVLTLTLLAALHRNAARFVYE